MTPIDAEVGAMLDEAAIVRVATVSASGAPHAAPFWFHHDRERIYVDTLKNQTVGNLRRDPRAAVLVDLGEDFAELRGALITARARIHEEDMAPPHVRRGVDAIRAAHAAEIETAVFAAYAAKETRPVRLVELEVERVRRWNLAGDAAR